MKGAKADRTATWIPASLIYRSGTLAVACAIFLAVGFSHNEVTGYIFGAIAGVLAVRTLMVRLVVSAKELRIVNPFRSYRIGWDDVENVRYENRGFSWIGRGFGATRHRVIVERKNGIAVSIAASQSVHRDVLGRSLPGGDRTERCLQEIQAAWRGNSNRSIVDS